MSQEEEFESRLVLEDENSGVELMADGAEREAIDPVEVKSEAKKKNIVRKFLQGIWDFLKTIFVIFIATISYAIVAILAAFGIVCLLIALVVIVITLTVVLVPVASLILGIIFAAPEGGLATLKKEILKK